MRLLSLFSRRFRTLRAEALEERSRLLREHAARLRATGDRYETMFARFAEAEAAELDDTAALLRLPRPVRGR